ncbi:MAG: hypothetical protein ACR2HJ_04790 [Fimbriimonadales bacterium]
MKVGSRRERKPRPWNDPENWLNQWCNKTLMAIGHTQWVPGAPQIMTFAVADLDDPYNVTEDLLVDYGMMPEQGELFTRNPPEVDWDLISQTLADETGWTPEYLSSLPLPEAQKLIAEQIALELPQRYQAYQTPPGNWD